MSYLSIGIAFLLIIELIWGLAFIIGSCEYLLQSIYSDEIKSDSNEEDKIDKKD